MLKRLQRFDGILFDMGDVFYDATTWRRWLTAELNGRGIGCTYDNLVVRWERLLVDVYCGRASYWERFTTLLSSFSLPDSAALEVTKAARECAEAVTRRRRLFDGVAHTLAQLNELGVRLGVLTDTELPGRRIRGTLDSLGIGHLFHAVVSSHDIGHAKPERAAFDAAVIALSVDPGRCAFVGHDAEELHGAGESGLYTIAYNFANGVTADAYLKDFADLIGIVVPNTIPTA